MQFEIELERKEDGRWIAEVKELPGVLAYGSTREKALVTVRELARNVIDDRG